MPTPPLHHIDFETIYEIEYASGSEDDSGNPSVRDWDSRRLQPDPDPARPLSGDVSRARDRRLYSPPPPHPRRPRADDPGRPFCRRRRGGWIPCGSGRWAAALRLRSLRRRRGVLSSINKTC